MANVFGIKVGDTIRVGDKDANLYSYNRLVGKELKVTKMTSNKVYGERFDKNSQERWFISMQDALPIQSVNRNFAHLLSQKEDTR